ncbi:MAG: hypothetical protein K2L72_05315 [Clostridia bacterium]|nr:hypothetical protein [Clostridia bacterium]
MTVLEIIDAFTFYGLDVILLAAVTSATVQIFKLTVFKNCRKKILTFAPFVVGSLLYASYAALVNLSFKFILENYVNVLEHGFSVGALSTLIYVWYEQFMRDKKTANATAGVISTLIDGYVPDDSVEEIAAQIATAIEKDVTGDGAKKTAEILTAAANGEQVTESDIKMLSRLIIETLAHISTN